MLKCEKCSTLYSHSAKICLYCKTPLIATVIDDSSFDYKIREFSNENEAEEFKIGLVTSEILCVTKREGDKFAVYISENSKRKVFDPHSKNVFTDNEVETKRISPRAIIATIFGVLFLIIFFLIYHSSLGKKFFLKEMNDKIIIVPEESEGQSNVDLNIAERKSTSHPEKLKQKEKKSQSDALSH